MSLSFVTTVQSMLAVVPLSEMLLRQDLEKAIGDSTFRAPESEWLSWGQLDRALVAHFGKRESRTDWERAMVEYRESSRP